MPRTRSRSAGRRLLAKETPKLQRKESPEPPLVREFDVTDDNAVQYTPEKDQWNGEYEFGGPIGAAGLILFSHFIVYYVWLCIDFFDGQAVYPGAPVLQGKPMLESIWKILSVHATPTTQASLCYICFLLLEYVMAVTLPGGLVTYGHKIDSENNKARKYYCNAWISWYGFIGIVAVCHATNFFPLYTIRDEFGHFLTTSVIIGDVVAVFCYVDAFRGERPSAIRLSGNAIYDFFMGASLNPRLPGGVDLKIYAEIRNSWKLLSLLTWSCAASAYRDHGYISGPMCLLLYINFLYVNAIQKGEHVIPYCWDITWEKFGWMLIYWNFVGVPFLYAAQPMFVQRIVPDFEFSPVMLVILFVIESIAYMVWDLANAQKNLFKMRRIGVNPEVIYFKCFPSGYIPWRHIPNPKTIRGPPGSGHELFVDGLLQYARKIAYTADVAQSTLWCLCCGLEKGWFVSYFYLAFFVGMLVHREQRDCKKCERKYGQLWKEYVRLVPAKFIPGVF